MKNFLFALLIVTLSASTIIAGEGSLTWKGFDDGMAEAKKTNKKVLIDIYTDWCSWCKVMDSKTYSDKGIIEYLSKRYVLIKLNAESAKKVTYKNQQMSEQELAGAFGITGYPSTLFMKSNGDAITVYPGFADAAKFKLVASFIGEDHYLNTKFEDYINRTKE